MQVLAYFERPEEERPPDTIWHHPQMLEEWWEMVEQRRRDESGGSQPVPKAEEPVQGMTERNQLVLEAMGQA